MATDNLLVSPSALDAASGDLVLVVCKPTGDEVCKPTGDEVCKPTGDEVCKPGDEVLRLKSLNCSIGPGWHCTLRLGADGVEATHGLTLQGPDGTIVRCWSPEMRLNGRPFTGPDFALAPGDRLNIGPIELEVLETVVLLESDHGGQRREQPATADLESTKPASEQSPTIEPLPQPPGDGDQESGDQQSIDQYMTDLMERVQANTDDLAVSYGSSSTAEPDAQPEPALPSTTPADADQVVRRPAPRRPCLEQLPPRAVAPESEARLSAMRELANFSAKNAISRHGRRKMIVMSRAKLGIASVAFACCGVLAWLWWRAGSGQLGLYAAIASLFIALLWAVEYVIVTIRLLRNRGRIDWDKVKQHKRPSSDVSDK